MRDRHPVTQLVLARLRESIREPGTIFWVFGFPILLSIGLGLAFRNHPPAPLAVGVVGEGAVEVESTLGRAGVRAQRVSEASARQSLRTGRLALVVVAAGSGEPLVYRYDPMRDESRLARASVDQALQRAAGRGDPRPAVDQEVTEPGSRYIDFLIPGLIGMNLMSGSMWGIGQAIANMRIRKLLKRLAATPMKRRHWLLAQALARAASVPLEVGTLLGFGWLAFGIALRGGLLALSLVSVVGALSFAGIAVLVASRAQNIETASGLMNLVTMPMLVLSGVFFASSHFPDAIQPLIGALPLTALNDALRAVIIDGASLADVAGKMVVMGAWGLAAFVLALRIFRWS